ncbi:MAG: indole-3-glycerol phosphate synthase TrpC [Phycisphaerales bacterium]|nr:indole-3-glycerol phosphate synthase TrpC [Phycisphaerales bacterium]
MSSVLDRIAARKRIEVAKAKAVVPVESLRERVATIDRPRNFFRAVVDETDLKHTRVIAEIKRKSPSAGVIREDFDPVRIAQQYHRAGAAALSCLTDESDFGGRLEFIEAIRDAVPLPVLRKDFIVDEYQVWESRAAGADAILLIAEVLSEGDIIDFQILATELGMTALVEAHSVENLLKVRNHIGFPHSGYSLLGINNRDLATMQTSISHTFRLLDIIDDRAIRRVLVSESGITGPDDLTRLREHGVNIVLVGEHLMRQPDPEAALKALLNGVG